jgi:hypothetical protein
MTDYKNKKKITNSGIPVRQQVGMFENEKADTNWILANHLILKAKASLSMFLFQWHKVRNPGIH